MEIFVLALGAKSGIDGLREFCLLSAILLAYDFVIMFTWYTAVLALKLEVSGLIFFILSTNMSLTYTNLIFTFAAETYQGNQ
jgi:hypothetical protein